MTSNDPQQLSSAPVLNATWLYVAVVYALAIWVARRGGARVPWRIAAFFYAIVLVYMFDPLTRNVVNLPADFIGSMPPWIYRLYPRRTVANPVLNDLVLQIAPWAQQARESWKHLAAPLWNNFAGSGYPLLANAQSSALSPLRILAVPLPLGFAFAAEAAWKLLIALTFTYLLCRRRGYGELASASGACAFGFCSFLIVWLHFPLVTAACMLPAILFAVELLAEKVTYKRFLIAAVTWTVMLFGGHPETASHAFFLALLLVFWIVAVERPFASRRELFLFIASLCGALAVAALLAAPYLAPLVEAITKSKRYHELQALPNAIGYYSDWMSTIAWLQPQFYGGIGDGTEAWGPATAESITGFAGILGVAAWFSLGIHVVATRRWRSREAFFVAASAIVLGIVLAIPGVSELFHLVFKLAANARLRLLLCMLMALQTAAVIDLLVRGYRKTFLAGLIAAATVLLLTITTIAFPLPWHLHNAIVAMAPSVFVLLAATIAAVMRRGQHAAIMVVAMLAIGELWAATRGWNPTVPASMLYPKTPLLEALDAERAKHPPTDPFRVVGLGAVFFPNISTMYGFEDIRAHDPMANGRYLGLLRVLGNYDTNDYFAKWTDTDTPLLDFLNVRYVIAAPKANLGGRYLKVYDGKDGTIFENTAVLPRFYPVRNVILEFNNDRFIGRLKAQGEWATTSILKSLDVASDRERTDLLAPRPKGAPIATLRMQRVRPTKFEMTIDAPRYTLVASSIPWWPGWKATIAGEEISTTRINGGFLGFVVPPGMTDVVVSYDPITFRGGMWLMGLTVLGLAAWPHVRGYTRRREVADVSSPS